MAVYELAKAFQAREAMTLQVPQVIDCVGEKSTREADPRSNLWERWAPAYDKLYGLVGIQVAANRFVGTVPKLEGEATGLDAGCGNGEIIARLVRRLPDANIVGLDYSPNFLRGAQERLGTILAAVQDRVALYRADLTQPLPFDDKRFDFVTANLVFQYLSKDEQNAMLAGIAPKMREGATLHLSTFVKGESFGRLVPALLGREIQLFGNADAVEAIKPYVPITMEFEAYREQGLMNHPSVEELGDMCKAAGFRDFQVAGKMFDEAGVFTIATR